MRSSSLRKSIGLYPKNIIDQASTAWSRQLGGRCSTLGRALEKGPGFSAWAWGYSTSSNSILPLNNSSSTPEASYSPHDVHFTLWASGSNRPSYSSPQAVHRPVMFSMKDSKQSSDIEKLPFSKFITNPLSKINCFLTNYLHLQVLYQSHHSNLHDRHLYRS